MQQSPLTLRQKLIDAVDERYHVKDMATIVEVLGTLERLPVTKELLETTRLGKTVNEFRKRINHEKLAKRAKALVKKWRDAVLEPGDSQQLVRPVNGNSISSISEGPGPGPGGQHGSQQQHQHPLSSLGSLQQAYASGMGYNSTSSSPKLATSSKVSPSGSHNSNNSLSPRILTAVNSNSSSNRNGSRNNLDPGHRPLQSSTSLHPLAAMSSPMLGSTSLHVSSPSSTTYLKSKPSFGPTSSVYTQSSNHSPLINPKSPLSSSSSYAPNSEVVAKTNAANKRLRKEDNNEIVSNSGPPTKKARTMLNGAGIGGTLDDPLLFDELSKDSIISRTSDHSDGSSKAVSNVSSGAPLSAAPSPLTATHDSNLSPPLSVVGGGANSSISSAALINDDKIVSVPVTEIETSAGDSGAQELGAPVEASKRGRKRKKKVVMDSESLLREQIAKAQAEGKIKAIEKLSRETNVDDERSRSPGPDLRAEEIRRAHIAALSPDNLVIKNEIVEKYLKSQNELKAQMERQYQDAVARNEITFDDDEDTNQKAPAVNDETKIKSKKKDKKRKKDGFGENSTALPFPTESEILARLPPIDPQILADFEGFVYYTDPVPEDDQKEPKSEKETENLTNNSTSLSSSNQQTNQQTLVGTKIDWGDSEDEDEDFEEVKIPDASVPPPSEQDEVDHKQLQEPMIIESLPDDLIAAESVPNKMVAAPVVENEPLREVDESEVERLHSEKISNLNGNVDKEGEFREWQETLTVESFNGDLLHILPYTIIDF